MLLKMRRSVAEDECFVAEIDVFSIVGWRQGAAMRGWLGAGARALLACLLACGKEGDEGGAFRWAIDKILEKVGEKKDSAYQNIRNQRTVRP